MNRLWHDLELIRSATQELWEEMRGQRLFVGHLGFGDGQHSQQKSTCDDESHYGNPNAMMFDPEAMEIYCFPSTM